MTSKASTPILSNINSSHPVVDCLVGTAEYWGWVFVSRAFEKGSEEYETACLRYKWHIAKCDVCRKGLGK